jgi:general stress protein YciG
MADTGNQGFAAMDPEEQREITRKGEQKSGGNFKNNPGKAREAGRKGGKQ